MHSSLVPANTKKAQLIMGMLRPIDAMILGAGISLSVVALIFVSQMGTLLTIIACIPMLVCLLLVIPIPNYHNTLVGIQSIMRFYQDRRKYIWRGWCSKNEFK